MKKVQFILKTLFVMALATSIVSCGDDDENPPAPATPTATAFVNANANFSSLGAALERAGLAATLDGAGPFTIFAPTNLAFQEFLNENGFASLEAVPVDVLRNTLLNHVVAGSLLSTALTNGYVKTSATNADGDLLDMYVDVSTVVVLNGEAEVTAANTVVSNGIIHVVDAVIALPTVVTLAAANPNFSNLVDALLQEDLDLVLSASTAPAPFTVFAPLNSSFDALIAENPVFNNFQDVLNLSNLAGVLTYHVVGNAAVRAEDITNGQVVTTVQTGTFTINTTTGVQITDANGRIINVVATNVTAMNGVVHAISNVLLPL